MSVSALPPYQIENVPAALRQLANRIEHGDIDAEHVVICMLQSDGDANYAAFGPEPFTVMLAMGLLEGVKFKMMGIGGEP